MKLNSTIAKLLFVAFAAVVFVEVTAVPNPAQVVRHNDNAPSKVPRKYLST